MSMCPPSQAACSGVMPSVFNTDSNFSNKVCGGNPNLSLIMFAGTLASGSHPQFCSCVRYFTM